MGLDFIRAKGVQFEQKRDKSKILETDVHELLSRGKPDEVVALFQCQLSDLSTQIIPGLPIIARAYSEADVRLILNSKEIGVMLPEDAQNFVDLMRKNRRMAGLLSVIPQEEPSFDGVFAVKPKTPFKKQ